MEDTPCGFLLRQPHARFEYMPVWDDMEPEVCTLLTEICEGAKSRNPLRVYQRDMSRPDYQRGWAVCMLFARGLVEIDRDYRDLAWLVLPTYGTIAHFSTHGFRPASKYGDETVANPHRKRAINLEN